MPAACRGDSEARQPVRPLVRTSRPFRQAGPAAIRLRLADAHSLYRRDAQPRTHRQDACPRRHKQPECRWSQWPVQPAAAAAEPLGHPMMAMAMTADSLASLTDNSGLLAAPFVDAAERYPDRLAVVDDEQALTYGELARRIRT